MPGKPANSSSKRSAASATDLVVLITGASSGIGAALARRLAADGRSLMLHGRTQGGESGARLAKVQAECISLGAPACEAVCAELGDQDAVDLIVDQTLERFGRLDQIVSNAGYAQQMGVSESDWASLAQAMAIMPLTFAALIRRAAPALSGSACGRIVGMSSFVAHRFEGETPFIGTAAAKAAMEAIGRSAAAELAPRGITVNCVAPGYTRKDRPAANSKAWAKSVRDTPLGRIATPEKIAEAVRFLLSEDAAHITGEVIRVDGGLTLL